MDTFFKKIFYTAVQLKLFEMLLGLWFTPDQNIKSVLMSKLCSTGEYYLIYHWSLTDSIYLFNVCLFRDK